MYKLTASNFSQIEDREVFYRLKNNSLRNIKNIIRWADKNGVLTRVTMLDVAISLGRIKSDKDFKTVLNLIDEKSRNYFVIILRKNLNLFGILYDELVRRDMLEIGIRGINIDSKEYFIMILLEKEFLPVLKRIYDIEPIVPTHGESGWKMRETDDKYMPGDFEETESLELKKSTSEVKEAIISISAILNKHQKGELYFGIKNDGKIVGQDVSEQTIRDVSKAISDNIEPKIYPKINKVSLSGKNCIYVAFSGSESPYFAYGRAYIRVGDEDKQLSAKELEKLFLIKNESNQRWDNRYSDIKISQIDKKLLRNYVERGKSAGRINFDFKSVQATLKRLKLIRDDRILNAAELLFCEDNPFEVQAAVFAGRDKTTFLDIKVFKGSLFDLLKQSELYISERMNWRVEFKDFKRVEIPEIPVETIREALVNSLCHRDYFRAEGNKIAIFRDRIKIYNPGEFPARFEPSDYIRGNAESVHRNPLISEILYFSKDVERWGTGIKRIYDICKEHAVKVEFKKEKGGFSTVFYRTTSGEFADEGIDNGLGKGGEGELEKGMKDTGNQFPEKVPRKSSQKILDFIKENPELTITELAQRTGISDRAVKKNIKKLKDDGLLKRVGPDKGGYWEVAGDEKTG